MQIEPHSWLWEMMDLYRNRFTSVKITERDPFFLSMSKHQNKLTHLTQCLIMKGIFKVTKYCVVKMYWCFECITADWNAYHISPPRDLSFMQTLVNNSIGLILTAAHRCTILWTALTACVCAILVFCISRFTHLLSSVCGEKHNLDLINTQSLQPVSL